MRRFSPLPLVVTLAIALAFNVVSASVLTALLDRPFPYPELERVVLVRDARPTDGAHQGRAIAAADFFDLRSQVPAFSSLAAYRPSPLVIASQGADPERIEAAAVTANFFSTLGVRPAHGALWPENADEAGRDRFVVLSRRLWHARFGDDPGTVGREITLNGRNVVVAAIIGDADCYPAGIDAWVPLALTPPERAERAAQRLTAIARLAPNAPMDAARAQLDSAAARLAAQFPMTNQNRSFNLLPLRREQYEVTAPLFGLVQVAALLVLSLAIVNVATVLRARQMDRAQELAIRSMLGASRADLTGLIVREVGTIAAPAAAAGVLLSVPAVDALRASLPEGIARWVNGWPTMHVDGRAVAVGIGCAALAAAIVGGVLAAHVSTAVHAAGSGVRATRRRDVGRRVVVAGEVALAAALLLCAFAVVQGLHRQTAMFEAFAPSRLLRFTITLPPARYPDDAHVGAFHTRLLEAIEDVSSIEAAALIRNEPASNVPSPLAAFERLDAPARSASDRPRADLQVVSPSTFAVLRMPVLEGRGFASTDAAESARVAVVSRLAMQHFWTDRNPIGTSIHIGESAAPVRIVGVVSDVELNWYDGAARPTIYVPDAQAPSRTTSVVIRTRVDPVSTARDVRAVVARLDGAQPIGGLEPLATSIADSLSPIRVIERMLEIAAGVACLLAALGLFGVLAQSVRQRVREFGVRFALGATPQSIASMVVRDALVTSACGIVAGLAFAAAIVRLAGSVLVGVMTVGAATMVLVAAGTVALVIASALAPALRAARVDAGTLLRS